MVDEKWLRYQALTLSKRSGLSMQEAYEQVRSDPLFADRDEFVPCETCGVRVKRCNLTNHAKKHASGPRIRWGAIDKIQRQRQQRKRLKKLAGEPRTQLVQGGSPGLGKKK